MVDPFSGAIVAAEVAAEKTAEIAAEKAMEYAVKETTQATLKETSEILSKQMRETFISEKDKLATDRAVANSEQLTAMEKTFAEDLKDGGPAIRDETLTRLNASAYSGKMGEGIEKQNLSSVVDIKPNQEITLPDGRKTIPDLQGVVRRDFKSPKFDFKNNRIVEEIIEKGKTIGEEIKFGKADYLMREIDNGHLAKQLEGHLRTSDYTRLVISKDVLNNKLLIEKLFELQKQLFQKTGKTFEVRPSLPAKDTVMLYRLEVILEQSRRA
ncbi:hypothetical protein M0P98_08875 [bacterium]|nr:hypothetical protein [bacterium]